MISNVSCEKELLLEDRRRMVTKNETIPTYEFRHLQEDVAEIKKDVKSLTNLISDPEKGMIARIKDIEKSKVMWTRVFWIVTTCLLSIVTTALIRSDTITNLFK